MDPEIVFSDNTDKGAKKRLIERMLIPAIKRLNWLYGRGDVVKVDFAAGKVTCKKQYGSEVRNLRVERRPGGRRTVFFRGHQQTVGAA